MHQRHPPAIAVVGDINADLSFALPAFPREGDDTQMRDLRWGSGGGGLNSAVAFAQLGARARLIGRVGSDPAAEIALRAARQAGADLALVQTDPNLATGLCSVLVSPGGQRSFLSFRGANTRCDLAAIDQAALQSCTLLVVNGYALLEAPQQTTALTMLGLAAAAGIPCALDLCLPAIRLARERIDDLLPRLWLLTLNEDEQRALLPGQSLDQALNTLLGAGVRTVAIKRGARGCSAAHELMRVDVLPPVVPAIDTNACGDAFTAGFAWARLHGADLADCAALGNLLGAQTARRPGAAEAIPTRSELIALLDGRLRQLLYV